MDRSFSIQNTFLRWLVERALDWPGLHGKHMQKQGVATSLKKYTDSEWNLQKKRTKLPELIKVIAKATLLLKNIQLSRSEKHPIDIYCERFMGRF